MALPTEVDQSALEFGYQKIRDWYQKNVALLDEYRSNADYARASRRFILALPA